MNPNEHDRNIIHAALRARADALGARLKATFDSAVAVHPPVDDVERETMRVEMEECQRLAEAMAKE
jgi:hypothetical protein